MGITLVYILLYKIYCRLKYRIEKVYVEYFCNSRYWKSPKIFCTEKKNIYLSK